MFQEKMPLLRRSSSESARSLESPYRGRRGVYFACLFIVTMMFLRVGLLYSIYRPFGPPSHEFHGDRYQAAARRILSKHPLIDGHDDLLIVVRDYYGSKVNNESFQHAWEHGDMAGQLDIPRLKSGQMGGAFWSAWVPCIEGTDFSDEKYAPSVRATLEQLELFNRLAEEYPKYFTLPRSAAEAEHNFKHGKLISPLAIEGLHQIGNSASILRLYHRLGVRYATLNHNCHNIYADAALNELLGVGYKATPLWHGISQRGRAMVHEMNRLGMLVDLSHVSPDTMRDALHGNADTSAAPEWSGSLAPPIFSHSSAYSICPHPRNVPDDVLHLVRKRNALVMVNILPDFISCVPSDNPTGIPEYVPANATLAQVVRHIMYIGDLIGYDHVGIGTDFDGMLVGPEGLEGVDKFPDLVAELLREGVSERDVIKIIGGNLLRVWAEADAVSRRMKKEGWLPLEDDVGKIG